MLASLPCGAGIYGDTDTTPKGQSDTVSFLAAGDLPVRISVVSDGSQANALSMSPSINGDGRFVAFTSDADNLVPGDTNGDRDVFVHDRLLGETIRMSVASQGSQANDISESPSISADGRYVAFASVASNLVFEDTNGHKDIFVHDRLTGQTTRVSVASDGGESDGRSDSPSISADGQYVAYVSVASNLVPGDTNLSWDTFVHDRLTGQTTRVSIASDGSEASSSGDRPSISADGRYVAFVSPNSNLVSGDTNGTSDIFIHDRANGQTKRVSVDSDGHEGNAPSNYPSISADGDIVAFESMASNLAPGDTEWTWDVFVHDRVAAQTTRLANDTFFLLVPR